MMKGDDTVLSEDMDALLDSRLKVRAGMWFKLASLQACRL